MKTSNRPEMKLDERALLGVRNFRDSSDTSSKASEKGSDLATDLGRLHSKVGVTGEDF